MSDKKKYPNLPPVGIWGELAAPVFTDPADDVLDMPVYTENTKMPSPAGHIPPGNPIPAMKFLTETTVIKSGSKRPKNMFASRDKAKADCDEEYPDKCHIPKMSECSSNSFSSEDLESIKSSVKIIKTNSITTVVAVVFDTKDEGNKIVSIRCAGEQPVIGHIYDHGQDCYLVRGLVAIDLGRFDFSLKIAMPGAEEWVQNIPIPDNILEKNFSAVQRRIVEDARKSYGSPRYGIKYIQMID